MTTTVTHLAGGAPVEAWERTLARWRDRLRRSDPRTLARLQRAQVWLLWGALVLVVALVVVRPQYRESLAVYVACMWTLVLWFVVARTKTVSWAGVARMFAAGVPWACVIGWVSFRLAAAVDLSVNAPGPGTAIAGLTEESLKLVPVVVVALVAPGRARRFAAADWLLLGLAAGMGFQAWEDVVRRLADEVAPSLSTITGGGPGSGYPQYGWGLLSGGFGTWSGDEVYGYPGHHVTTALVAGCAGLGIALWRSGAPAWRVAGVALPAIAWLDAMAIHVGYNASLRDRDWTTGDGDGTAAPWGLRTWWDVTGQGTGRGWLLVLVLLAALLADARRLHRAGPVTDLHGDGWWARPRLAAGRSAGTPAVVASAAAFAAYAARDLVVTALAHARAPGEGRRAAIGRGRATSAFLRRVRLDAVASLVEPPDGTSAGEGRARAAVRGVAVLALVALLAVGLAGAALLASRIGQDLTPDPGWLAGQLDGLGGWWDDRSTGEKLLIGAAVAAVVVASGGSLGLALGVSGGAVYLAEHGHGAASFARDPAAATRSWWSTTTPTGAALDVAEFGLTFLPAGLTGAAAGAQIRGVGRYATNDLALRYHYRGGWAGEGGLRLDARDYESVRALAGRAAAAEESITPRLGAIVEDLPEGELVGLDKRLKEMDSLSRKVATDLSDPAVTGSVDDIGAGVKDALRYTVEVPGSSYGTGVAQAVGRMRAEGFEIVKWRNGWIEEGGFQGINSAWRDPRTGHVFEVQFHTPESFHAKTVTHDLYQQIRLPGIDRATEDALQAQQNAVFDTVPEPAGALELTKRNLGLGP
jgi:RsiW-degrading membrane proteinase PrsW (M82 family)